MIPLPSEELKKKEIERIRDRYIDELSKVGPVEQWWKEGEEN